MKRRELIKKLEAAGFKLLRHGNGHDVYKRFDGEIEIIPRHREINERLARDSQKVECRLRKAGASYNEVPLL